MYVPYETLSLRIGNLQTESKDRICEKGVAANTQGFEYFLRCTNATSPPMTSKMQVNKARASLLVQPSIPGGLSKSKAPMFK